jgi:nucleotide-binding universal stress UspA family protein
MKILLATDGSECAHAAVDFMERFPFPRDGEATVLTVINRDDFKGKEEKKLSKDQRKVLRKAREMVQEESEKLLRLNANRLKKAGWKVAREVRDGHPAEEIVDAAKELGVDLIVMGCHGLSTIGRLFLGSISDAVLRHAHCSVLIVKMMEAPAETAAHGGVERPLNLLLAHDGSDAAAKAVAFCAALPFQNTDKVTVFRVLPLVGLYHQDIQQQLSGIWQQKKKNAQKALKKLESEQKWTTPLVSTQLHESDDVSQSILKAVSELDADLLVLGYKGKGAMEKLLVGSITAGIIHHAPCSILAVR